MNEDFYHRLKYEGRPPHVFIYGQLYNGGSMIYLINCSNLFKSFKNNFKDYLFMFYTRLK